VDNHLPYFVEIFVNNACMDMRLVMQALLAGVVAEGVTAQR